jgi:preprotein translocase subunit SecA
MRLFGSDRIAHYMTKMGMEEGEPLEHGLLNRSIGTAQRRVEQQNFSMRKRTLEYDDVMNKQREVIYDFRGDIVRGEQVRDYIFDVLEDVITENTTGLLSDTTDDAIEAYLEWVQSTFPVAIAASEVESRRKNVDEVTELLVERVRRAYELKISMEDPGALEMMERHIVLQAIDTHWQEYLRAMDALRQGVGLRAYGQRDPLVEYKREAYAMFEDLMNEIKSDIARDIFRSSTRAGSLESLIGELPQQLVHAEVSAFGAAGGGQAAVQAGGGAGPTIRRSASSSVALPFDEAMPPTSVGPVQSGAKVGRNDPCPCGSGKKYKKCCGTD